MRPKPTAHWACIGGLGGGDDPSLEEFDYNHKTEKQVFMGMNDI